MLPVALQRITVPPTAAYFSSGVNVLHTRSFLTLHAHVSVILPRNSAERSIARSPVWWHLNHAVVGE